jgi:hypothetical protein
MVEQFAALFRGRGDAIGLGHGEVQRRPVTLMDYEDHLRGEGSGIGIFPMLDTNECYFGAIDLDEPNFELAAAMQLLIPGASWVEQSRSGNAHVWVFFHNATPAWAIRTILRGATEAVGRKDVEIFPKQDQLRPGGVGNYINLPFHGTERPILVSGGVMGPALTVLPIEDFLVQAIELRHAPDSWERRARALGGTPPAEREDTGEWGEAPFLHECGAYIIEGALSGDRPITPGHRHQVMFHLAKQLLNWRDLSSAEAGDILAEVNASMPKPLYRGELERLFSNAITGQFTSTGCDDPVMAPYVKPDCPIASR